MVSAGHRLLQWAGMVILAIALASGSGDAQTAQKPAPALLVADDIQITGDRRLIAQGNVEAFQGDTRLTAEAIAYDPETGLLTITGPITIDDGDGVTILADQAELSDDMQNGLLLGARLVLNDQVQLAAVQLNRVDGKYSQLYKTAATSCRLCAGDSRPPLWEIRARRVVHDQDAQQLYFDEAQLRVRNIPVLYLPRLRMPDPTLERASGFLFPEIRSDTQLGTGIKLPYFIKLDDHRDLTLTPYLSNNTRTVEFRYRQAFTRGRLLVQGALSNDDVQGNDSRGYLFAAGRFDLKRDFRLQFDIELVSDDAYLSDYAYSGKDRLDSQIRLSRARRDSYLQFSYINYKSLRSDEDDDVLPSDVIEALYERRYFPAAVGGEIRLSAQARALERQSGLTTDVNGDGVVDGRDMLRFSLDAEWLRMFQLGGLQAQTRLGVFGDLAKVSDDATSPRDDSEIAPTAALTLRYPLVRQGGGGARQILEPVVQLAWIGGDGLNVPNEESTRVEFDEGNLISLSRFPASDRRERGWSAAVGATWARVDPDGWSLSVTAGQVMRRDAQTGFAPGSGLSGKSSDFLLAGQMRFDGGLTLSGRTIFDEQFDVAKAELRGGWNDRRLTVGGSYIWMDEDPAINQINPIGEIAFDGAYRIDRFWTASFDMRYDIEIGRAATAGAGLTYENECLRVGLSVNRSFADSTTVEPTTSLGLTVSLRGFSAYTGERTVARKCGKQAR